MINQLKEFLKNHPNEFLFRILTTLLSMFILPHIAIVMFIVYMSQNNFFSYDLFSEGLFGMKLFFSVTAFMIVILGFLMTGSIGLFIVKMIKSDSYSITKELKSGWWSLAVLNILVLVVAFTSSNFSKFLYLVLLSITINSHIWLMVHGKAKMQFISLIIVTVIIGYSTIFIFAKDASNLLTLGLNTFRMGGKNTIAEIKSQGNISHGDLLLITPNNVFLKDENESVYIFPMNNIERIIVKKKSQTVPKND